MGTKLALSSEILLPLPPQCLVKLCCTAPCLVRLFYMTVTGCPRQTNILISLKITGNLNFKELCGCDDCLVPLGVYYLKCAVWKTLVAQSCKNANAPHVINGCISMEME